LLGGQIDLISQVGVGSTFSLTIPLYYVDGGKERADEVAPQQNWQIDESRIPVLVVDDEPEARLIYEKYLGDSPFQALAVSNLRQARAALRQNRPRAIILDIVLRGEDAWTWLAELKRDEFDARYTDHDRVCRRRSRQGARPRRRRLLRQAAGTGCVVGSAAALDGCCSPIPNGMRPGFTPDRQVMIIDDEPAARYVLSKLLLRKSCRVQEAENGVEGCV
jgi:CheY-like chemotaxis protein